MCPLQWAWPVGVAGGVRGCAPIAARRSHHHRTAVEGRPRIRCLDDPQPARWLDDSRPLAWPRPTRDPCLPISVRRDCVVMCLCAFWRLTVDTGPRKNAGCGRPRTSLQPKQYFLSHCLPSICLLIGLNQPNPTYHREFSLFSNYLYCIDFSLYNLRSFDSALLLLRTSLWGYSLECRSLPRGSDPPIVPEDSFHADCGEGLTMDWAWWFWKEVSCRRRWDCTPPPLPPPPMATASHRPPCCRSTPSSRTSRPASLCRASPACLRASCTTRPTRDLCGSPPTSWAAAIRRTSATTSAAASSSPSARPARPTAARATSPRKVRSVDVLTSRYR